MTGTPGGEHESALLAGLRRQFDARIDEIARRLLGEPNRALSSRTHLGLVDRRPTACRQRDRRGLGSTAGSCVGHVVGLQCSIREWSMRQGWDGRPIGEKQAHVILVAALGVLVHHYGSSAGKRSDRRSGTRG